MPLPMVPAPSTATVLMESIDNPKPFANEIEDAWDADGGQACEPGVNESIPAGHLR
jgi:hypothetical protein